MVIVGGIEAILVAGPIISLIWASGVLLFSNVIPDENRIVAEVLGSPGSAVTFIFQYLFLNQVPTHLAENTENNAVDWAIDWVVWRRLSKARCCLTVVSRREMRWALSPTSFI